MTPIRGLLKKLLGTATPTPRPAIPPPGRVDPPVAHDTGDDDGGRRRGSRGGRGRGAGAAAVATTEPAPTTTRTTATRSTPTRTPAAETDAGPRAYAWGSRGQDDQVRQRRDQVTRQRRPPSRGGFRPLRENLEPPLPEDVAFRPQSEGGDGSILPSRRRRPSGLRDTIRVLVGGARSLSGWSRPFDTTVEPAALVLEEPAVEPEPSRETLLVAIAPAAPAAPAAVAAPEVASTAAESDAADDSGAEADTAETTAEGLVVRRRRGRRGGRGRRHPDGADGAAADAGLDEADAVAHDDADAYPEAPESVDDRRHDSDDGVPGRTGRTATVAASEPRDDAPRRHTRSDDADADADERDAPAPRERRARTPQRSAAPKIATADLPAAFAALGISETALRALAGFGFSEPTPIQARAIPALMEGKDIVGVAQTGSGKTIAFGVPMMECLDRELPEVQAIVLVPTRELAQQVLEVLSSFAASWGLEAVGILGGHSLASDFKALDRRPAIVVGTPGRVIDHLGRGTLSLRFVRYAVLDEADQMLDIGFLPDIRRILSRTPRQRQTSLFSATMPSAIRRLIWQFMNDPETVTVDPELSTVDTIEQLYFEVASRDKTRGLRELIERELKGRTLVFCKMKRSVDRLERDLAHQGVRVGALHGDMDQRQRDRVVQEFRAGSLDILIATNVAARGLDIPEITHVVNFDVPQNAEEYVHRIGRTGRAGRDGKAITFVSEWDMGEWDAIASAFPDQIHQEHLDIYHRGERAAQA
ncbi:MAG: DEAD/DEAH box helicase [Dehalococcoidia bacterium]|nr:DEAD/DEAH box helicase [Dehalococcoidia bacterium]